MKSLFAAMPILLALVSLPETHAAPIPTAPVYTNKPRFRIPFRYDPAEMKGLGAKEVRLFVSNDRGGLWQQVQSVAPETGKFNFQAPSDGEYWFIVRTLDSKDRLHPDGPIEKMEPGLKVVVDSIGPRLELDLRQTTPGRVQLIWSATDAYLDPTQLRLEYQQPGVDSWQIVSVVPKATGQTEWSIPQGGVVAVRGTISDMARNMAQNETQARIAAGGDVVPRPAVPDLRQPIAANDERQMAANAPGQFNANAIPASSATPATPVATSPETVVATEEKTQFQPIRPGPKAINAAGPAAARNLFASQQTEPDIVPGPEAAAAPIIRNNVTARQRLVNTRQFQIGYKLQDVGPSGVSGVELFITQDDGASWFKYGDDPDNQSPAQVEVPKEGVYGFALGVKSGVGISSDPPQPGEKPSIVVVVDQTAPKIELLPLEQGRGRSVNKILIQWKYTDDFPADKPVAISFSANGQGPWQSITGWQENTGNYVWTVGPGVPSKFFIRIEARDAAGNVRSAETAQPVLIDLSRPTARIIDIESASGPQ